MIPLQCYSTMAPQESLHCETSDVRHTRGPSQWDEGGGGGGGGGGGEGRWTKEDTVQALGTARRGMAGDGCLDAIVMELICWAKSEIAVASATTTIIYLATTTPTTNSAFPASLARTSPLRLAQRRG